MSSKTVCVDTCKRCEKFMKSRQEEMDDATVMARLLDCEICNEFCEMLSAAISAITYALSGMALMEMAKER